MRPRPRDLLLALLWLACPILGHGETLGSLQTKTRSLAIDHGTRLRHSTATITALLNEGQRLAVLDSKALVKSARFELVAGTTFYELPADYFQMARVTLRNQLLLSEASVGYLDNRAGQGWQASPGTPTNYYIHFASRTKVGFYPFPGTSSSTGTVRYEYFASATDMSAISDEPFGGAAELDPYGYMLAYYAASILCSIDGRLDLAVLYRRIYDEGMARMKLEAHARAGYNPGAVPANSTNRLGP